MIILFQNILFLKECLGCNGCFGFFSKIKKESGTSFWCIFSAWFYHKNCSLFNIYSINGWSFNVIPFFLLKISNKNVLLSSYLARHMLMSKTVRFIFDQFLKQWLTGGKKGEDKNTKIWISWERKEFFRWNKKNIFHSFWRAVICWDKKKYKKIADASFKQLFLAF